MQFEFTTTTRILFGSGKLKIIGSLAGEFGKRALIVSGCPEAISDQLVNLLEQYKITSSTIRINQEPTVDSIRRLVDYAKQSPIDMVIGIGGGSALDSAKVASALACNPGDVMDYLEVIGLHKPLSFSSIPLIAIPTTSGTGSEVTKNAVLGSPQHHVKVSLRSPYLVPKIALVDPELTLSLPPALTAFTGLDALTQLIEPYTCNEPNPLIDALCQEGLQRVARSLLQAYDQGSDLQAREDMSLASLFSGISLANARLGAVHGLAGPLGGEIPAPHGAICASILPYVMEANLTALHARSNDHPALERYHTIGKILTGSTTASAFSAVQWVRDFCQYAKIPSLSDYGLTEAEFDKIVTKSSKASSMKGNPITLSGPELRNILQKSL